MKKFFNKIKFLFQIHKSLPLLFRFFTSKKISLTKRALFFLAIAGYAVVPTDLIADFIPVLGLVDDVTILSFLVGSIQKQYQQSQVSQIS